MPELPEVESFKRFIDRTSLGKPIESVKLAAPNMLLNTTARKLSAVLRGNAFVSTFRHGKFLFIKLFNEGNLLLHFGLTGDLEFTASGEAAPKKYALRFHFQDDTTLYFTDTRKMGKIALVDDVDSFIQERKYGPDALKISKDEFLNRVDSRKVAIKTVLMDQKVLAGVGNEFSDEVLFQSRIHPQSRTSALSKKQLLKIYDNMLSTLEESVRNDADREKLNHYFFLDNRKAGLACPRCKKKTSFETIGGRSSYFCPSCQKLYE